MNKKILTSLMLIGLLFAGTAFAIEPSYERTPTGYTITNPVSFEVSPNDYCDSYENPFYRLKISDQFDVVPPHWTDSISCSVPTHDFVETLELGEYMDVRFYCVDSENGIYDTVMLESIDGSTPIFEVVEGEPEPEPVFIFPDVSDFTTGAVSQIGIVFTDLAVPLTTIFGLGLALNYILPKVIGILKIKR